MRYDSVENTKLRGMIAMLRNELAEARAKVLIPFPISMVMYCPAGHLHIDEGEWTTRPHKTHKCQVPVFHCSMGHDDCSSGSIGPCGLEWRPANFPTVGVARTNEESYGK